MSIEKINKIIENINNLVKATGGNADFLTRWLEDDTQEQLLDIVKNKKLKDPEAPKGACSSYIFFCRDKRDKVKEENPEMNGKDITRELGRKWNELSEKKKAKYVKEAEEDKKRYKKEMEEYEPPSEEELKEKQPKKRKMSTKVKERNGPKRPTTSFLYFSKDMRQQVKDENPEMTGRDVTKELGRLWREDYDDESKEKWVKLYQKDKERYESEKSGNSESDEKSDETDSDEKSVSSDTKNPKKKARKSKSKAKKEREDDETDIEDD